MPLYGKQWLFPQQKARYLSWYSNVYLSYEWKDNGELMLAVVNLFRRKTLYGHYAKLAVLAM